MNKCSRENCTEDSFAKVFKFDDKTFEKYVCKSHFNRFYMDNLYPGCVAIIHGQEYKRYKCIALMPIPEQKIKEGWEIRMPCNKKADLTITLRHDGINAFGCYLSSYFCLDHIPQLRIEKINHGDDL